MLLVLVGFENSAALLVLVGFGQFFNMLCVMLQDSGSRVRLSTSWRSARACWVRSAGPPRHPRAPMAAVACGWPAPGPVIAIAALLHASCVLVFIT